MKRTDMGWRRASGLLLLAALAGCRSEQSRKQEDNARHQPAALPTVTEAHSIPPAAAIAPADTLPRLAAAKPLEPVWRVVSSPAQRRVQLVHRYVGTVGGEPATAELHWYSSDSVWGRFYLHRREPAYELLGQWNQPDSMVLGVLANDTSSTVSRWRLLSRPGSPVLKAVWQQGKQRRRVVLRESYVGAVRYGVRTVLYTDGARGSLLHDFLTLPASATVPQRLRSQLSPGPQARLRELTAVRDSLCDAQCRLCVRLNDCGLFSYQVGYECHPTDASVAGGVGLDSFLFDLVSGQPLTVESQLRPGYARPLRRLLVHHLPSDLVDVCLSNYLVLRDMPDAGMCLTWRGLEAAYEGPVKCGIISISVPYRELRPLVRPGTPLARMLRARGLW